MNYKQIYDDLITRGKQRVLYGYSEKHHIIPRCIGGGNDFTNLVRLTPEEHYLAHQLLVKIYPGNKSLVYAAIAMIRNRPGNKLYGWLRRRYSKVMSARVGQKNSQFGTRWISNPIEKISKRINKDEEIPTGWISGRNKWEKTLTCQCCNKVFFATKRKMYCSAQCKVSVRPDTKYKNGYTVEVDGKQFNSISEAADFYKIGHETARMRFKSNNFLSWKILGVA